MFKIVLKRGGEEEFRMLLERAKTIDNIAEKFHCYHSLGSTCSSALKSEVFFIIFFFFLFLPLPNNIFYRSWNSLFLMILNCKIFFTPWAVLPHLLLRFLFLLFDFIFLLLFLLFFLFFFFFF